MRKFVPFCGALTILALSAGCAKIEAPEVCLGGMAVPFPPDTFDVATEDAISADELGVPDDDSVDLTVNVRSVALAPMSGVDDLEFLDRVTVHAAPAAPDSALPELALVEMDAASMTEDGSMYGEPAEPVDISEHLRDGEVLFRIGATGKGPDSMWMAQMELCVEAVARYQL